MGLEVHEDGVWKFNFLENWDDLSEIEVNINHDPIGRKTWDYIVSYSKIGEVMYF